MVTIRSQQRGLKAENRGRDISRLPSTPVIYSFIFVVKTKAYVLFSDGSVVGDTGIEPVTPTMSR